MGDSGGDLIGQKREDSVLPTQAPQGMFRALSKHQEDSDFGLQEEPRDRSNFPVQDGNLSTEPIDFVFLDVWPVDSEVVKKAQVFAKPQLPMATYNHSIRVFCFGHAIVTQHHPEWLTNAFKETWALTCLFHMIGTIHRESTSLPFELESALTAFDKLQSFGVCTSQAESVCKAISRQQDLALSLPGTISRMAQLLQMATEFDNFGWNSVLIHEWVMDQWAMDLVLRQFPRMHWSRHFSAILEAQTNAKPWCTLTPELRAAVAKNALMQPYDNMITARAVDCMVHYGHLAYPWGLTIEDDDSGELATEIPAEILDMVTVIVM